MDLCKLVLTALGAVLLTHHSSAQDAAGTPLKSKTESAIDKGLQYLGAQQKPDGSWTSGDYPGLTALVVQAHVMAPNDKHRKDPAAFKGLEFIRSRAKPDGGIYSDRMANYNTSVCLATLARVGAPEDAARIEGARKFLIQGQVKNSAKPSNDGGFGYEPKGAKASQPDLDNTVFALEALRLARDRNQTSEKQPQGELDWQAALSFVSLCQKLSTQAVPESSDPPADEKGGFVYTPVDSGKEPQPAYGSMTYAGVLSFVYADLKQDDPRLLAAKDWLSRHYTLEENPGQGAQGLYYYYHLMAKGLTALKIDQLNVGGAKEVNWRSDLAQRLLSLQKPDGSWASENGRWMEKDPNLVTAYCLMALSLVHEGL